MMQSADFRKFERLYEAFIDSFSGAAGGVIASLIFYPIENFRTRVQAMDKSDQKGVKKLKLIEYLRQILDSEGYTSLYKGLKVALIGNIFSYGIYFWWYRFLKNYFALMLKKNQLSSIEMTAVTTLAGSISSVFSNPIWMLNTRMAIQKSKKSVFTVIKEILDTEGISAFFKGVLPNLILVINPIINFVVYEYLKVFALNKYGSERKIPFSAIFAMSSVGKILATFATYPILTIRVKLQADKSNSENKIVNLL